MQLYWQKLLTIGLRPGLSALDEQRVRLWNVINICTGILELSLGLMDIVWGSGFICLIMISAFIVINLVLYLFLSTHQYTLGFVYAYVLTHIIVIVIAGINRKLGTVDESQIVIIGIAAMGIILFDRYLQMAAMLFNVAVYWLILLVVKDESYTWGFRNYYTNIINFTVSYFFIGVCIYFTKSIFRQYQALILERNEQLSRQTIDLQELNQFKNRLLAVVSHDLRSPLYNLQKIIKLFRDGNLSVQQSKNNLREIQLKTNEVSQLLGNLLNWANMQISGYKSVAVEIPIYEVVNETVFFLRDEIELKNIQVINKVAPDVIGWGDENQLELVLRNLLNNAVKFSYADGIITIEAEEKPNEVIISIEDGGIGIHPEDFDMIVRGHARSSTPGTSGEKGNGLGLWISREFILKNGGEFRAVGREGGGTIFYFTLPKPKD